MDIGFTSLFTLELLLRILAEASGLNISVTLWVLGLSVTQLS